MADALIGGHPELQPFLLQNVRLTGKTIGAGAYGSVVEVSVHGAICVAKTIHDFFLNPTQVPSAVIRKTSTQFVRECQLMSTLRHPHIVQFLGVCFLPGSPLPALVMERLLTSLHDLLDPEIDPPPPRGAAKIYFPLALKVSIINNVASGLAYLHERSPPIIHRDLSARNVLLNSGMVAKIGDLGVARIMPGMERAAATMTKGPGAIVYMPPEAMESITEEENEEENDVKSKYDSSIDIFSFGVVAIFTLSQTFPCDLLAPTYRKNGRLLARTELERREKYMTIIYEKVRKDNPLLQMIEGCLDFPEKRPVISEVLSLLEQTGGEVEDKIVQMNKLDLVQALHLHQSMERELKNHVLELEKKFRTRNQEIIDQAEMKDRVLTEAQQHLLQKEEQLQLSDGENRKKMNQLQRMEVDLMRAEEMIRTQQEQIKSMEEELASSKQKTQQKLKVQCHEKKAAPRSIIGGSATTDSQNAYFIPLGSDSVHQYDYSTEEWKELPPCPYNNCGLAIINGELTTMAGRSRSGQTTKLMTLHQGKWVEEYPPMNTGCSFPAIATTFDGSYHFVIGGRVGGEWSAEVQLFELKSRKWYRATNLPKPLSLPSAIICGDQLHVIGRGRSGYTSSLRALQLPSLQQSLFLFWSPLPPLPVTDTTPATLCGQLVLVGGFEHSAISTIHQLIEGEWVRIGSMVSSRWVCSVVSSSLNRIIIIGGQGASESVEECVLTY